MPGTKKTRSIKSRGIGNRAKRSTNRQHTSGGYSVGGGTRRKKSKARKSSGSRRRASRGGY